MSVAKKKVGNLFLYVCSTLQNKELQWYPKEYCGLQCVHSHIGTEKSGYQNDYWYVHTNKMKKYAIIGCGKSRQVCSVVKK
jgi:hypothetical protein